MSRRSRSFNAFEQATTAAIDDAVTSIPLDSVTNLTPPGYLVIDPDNPLLREYIFYTEINALVLDNVSRGLEGSAGGVAQEHSSGARVRAVSVHQWLNDIFDDIEDLEDGTAVIPTYLAIDGGNAMAANLDMGGGGFRVVDMGNGLSDQDAATLKQVTDGDDLALPLAGTGLGTPDKFMASSAKIEWVNADNFIQFQAAGNFLVTSETVLRLGITDATFFLRDEAGNSRIALDVLGVELGNTSGTGAFIPPAGAVATPTYAFAEDATSGMYLDGVGALGFGTSGIQRMRVSSSQLLLPTISLNVGDDTATASKIITLSREVNALPANGRIAIGSVAPGEGDLVLTGNYNSVDGAQLFIGANGVRIENSGTFHIKDTSAPVVRMERTTLTNQWRLVVTNANGGDFRIQTSTDGTTWVDPSTFDGTNIWTA